MFLPAPVWLTRLAALSTARADAERGLNIELLKDQQMRGAVIA
jgi:hypothetical protein